jgi:alkylhydroperoxidase family enzyme
VDAVLDDFATAPISNKDKALFEFLEKMNAQSNRVRKADVDALKNVGWSEEAIYDAITVCALFKFYNAWIDATGVHDMPAEAYQMSGKRLATQGYRPSPAEV